MRVSGAILAGLAVAAGVWLWIEKPWREPRHSADPSAATAAADPAQDKPLYRWRNAQGVLQITDVPPQDRPYERVRIRSDQNIVPLSEPAPEPSE